MAHRTMPQCLHLNLACGDYDINRALLTDEPET
jgi:hypothetical protein